MKIDLHVHTSYSDSSLCPEETCAEAKRNGITHMAVCDHDTVAGLEETSYFCDKYGIIMIPGVEISAYDFSTEKKVHVLGYFFDRKAENITKLCAPILVRRSVNTLVKTKKLMEGGFPITIEQVKREAVKSTSVYKQHIMSVLIRKGITDHVYSDLYHRFFGKGGIHEKDITYADVHDAIAAIKNDGGKAVIAHPRFSGIADQIDKYFSCGIEGIEAYHPEHVPSDIALLISKATELGIVITGGSDFHGLWGDTCFDERYLTPEIYYKRLIQS